MAIALKMGLPMGWAMVLALGVSLAFGSAFAFAYSKLSNDSFAVLTLASLLAFDALLKSWDSVTGGVLGIAGVVRPELFSSLSNLAAGEGILACALMSVHWVLLRSPFGRKLRAIKENQSALSALGSSGQQIGFFIVLFSGLVAALSGLMSVWRIQFLDPSLGGISVLLPALTVAVVAYRPKTAWLALSALVVTLLPESLRFFHFPSSSMGHMRMLVYSALIILLLKNLSHRSSVADRIV